MRSVGLTLLCGISRVSVIYGASETSQANFNVCLARSLNVPLYELLGGQVRHKCQVYCWIGGDRPSDVEAAA